MADKHLQKNVDSHAETVHELHIGYNLLGDLFEHGDQTLELDNGDEIEISVSEQTADAMDYLLDAYDQDELYELSTGGDS